MDPGEEGRAERLDPNRPSLECEECGHRETLHQYPDPEWPEGTCIVCKCGWFKVKEQDIEEYSIMTIELDDDTLETCRSVIDKGVQQAGHGSPRFAAISGSHIYGFPSKEGGDIDLRGFHVAHANQRITVEGPKEQVIINQQGVTEGFEFCPDVELVSYELVKFGHLLSKMNFNILEWLFHGEVVMNGVPLEVESLKTIMREELPADVPRQYLGMAKSNYHKYLTDEKGSYTPTAKKFLYVTRGLLAAKHIENGGSIEPDVTVLAAKHLSPGDASLVESFVQVKLEHENQELDDDQIDDGLDLIHRLFNEVDVDSSYDYERVRERVNGWLQKVVA